jgi:hypothetical protein
MNKPLYKAIDNAVTARLNCIKSNNQEWLDKWTYTINEIESILPSGSGIDSGTIINLEKSKHNKIVLETSFHHMDDNGYYDGWTEHTITVTPDFLNDFVMSISGRNRNDIKEYLYQTYDIALCEDYSESL